MSQSEPAAELTTFCDRSGRGWLSRMQAQSQAEFDLEFYHRILERSGEYVDVLRCQGELLTHRGEHTRALEIDRRLARLRPTDCIVRYNLACSLSLLGQSDEALRELATALELGYDDFDHLECDRDLDRLRELPAFAQLLETYGAA